MGQEIFYGIKRTFFLNYKLLTKEWKLGGGGGGRKFYGSKKDCFEVHIFWRFCKINLYNSNVSDESNLKKKPLQSVISLATMSMSAS